MRSEHKGVMAEKKKRPSKSSAVKTKRGTKAAKAGSAKKSNKAGKAPAKKKAASKSANGKGAKSRSRKPPPKAPQQASSRDGKMLLGVGAVACVVVAALAFAQQPVGTPSETDGTPVSETGPAPTDSRAEARPSLATTIPESLRARIVARYPHDPDAFTQGLLWHQGKIYESTGLEGRSSLRRVDLATGAVERRIDVDPTVFAEGLARVDDRLIQLTWHDEVAYVYDLETFERRGEFSYQGEGWGLCYDGERLVMSDGSDELTFRDPGTFEELGHVAVTKVGRPVRRLNELECAQGSVYANNWQRDEIVRIDPATGRVTASIHVGMPLERSERRDIDVLNGIAYLPDSDRFLLTGKLWPAAFEVVFEPR